MTQAFNLAQLANNLNTSGQLDATDGLSGLVTNANLASSGTANSSTFLRGDRTWASVGNVGKVLQVQQTVKTNIWTSTTTAYTAVSGLSVSITPTATSSKILVMIAVNIGVGGHAGALLVYRNGSALTGWQASADTGLTNQALVNYYNNGDNNSQLLLSSQYLDSPNSTSSQTYQVYVALPQGGGTAVLNENTSQVRFQSYSTGGVSTITAMEIGA